MTRSPYDAPAAELQDAETGFDNASLSALFAREMRFAFYGASLLVFPLLVLFAWMQAIDLHGHEILVPLGVAGSYPVNFVEAPDDNLAAAVVVEFAWIFIWILLLRRLWRYVSV